MATKLMRSLRYCMPATLHNFEMLELVASGKKGKGGTGEKSRYLQNNPVLTSSNKINGWLDKQLGAFSRKQRWSRSSALSGHHGIHMGNSNVLMARKALTSACSQP